MAAYAAAVSLKHTIKCLENSSRVSFRPPACPEIELLYDQLSSMQHIFYEVFVFGHRESLLSSSVAAGLHRQIKEAVYKMEDVFDSHVSNQFLSQISADENSYNHDHPLVFVLDFQKLVPEINFFTQRSKEIQNEIANIDIIGDSPLLLFTIVLKKVIVSNQAWFQANSLLPCPDMEYLYEAYSSLQKFLQFVKRTNSTVDDMITKREHLDMQIRDELFNVTKSIRLLTLNNYRSQSESPSTIFLLFKNHYEASFSGRSDTFGDIWRMIHEYESFEDENQLSKLTVDLAKINEDINSFTRRVKEIEEDYTNGAHPVRILFPGQDNNNDDLNFFTATMKKIKEMYITKEPQLSNSMQQPVGLQDGMIQIRSWLTNDRDDLQSVTILGMAGIGKTTLAKQVYDDPFILSSFCDNRVWVTIGPNYEMDEIMMRILAQLNTELIDQNDLEGAKYIQDYVSLILKGRKYLIVLDDMWGQLTWLEFKRFFPDVHNGSRILLTTRQHEVAAQAMTNGEVHEMQILNIEESWDLLRGNLFQDKLCPPELVKAGKKIAENCEGLPLLIVAVGNHLSKAKMTLEYWNHIAENGNAVVIDEDDELSNVLLSSYKDLFPYLKACFLYMVAFPKNYEIRASKLINLWCAEGFIEPSQSIPLEEYLVGCLMELALNNLIMFGQQSWRGTIKTCKVHSAYWHVCVREAGKEKFMHVLSSYANSVTEHIQNQRRLCVHKNVLFGIKDVHESMASVSTTTRSLLCTGPPHQYPVPMCYDLRLLRVLDALAIRFYLFPAEVLKLLQLRYFAFTYNGKLPTSISKLWNLQYLIVRQSLRIKSHRAQSYLPVEIWNMKELRHLQVMGSDLPDPCGGSLPNLVTLLDVNAHNCTKEVLEGIPNLKKLGIQIELSLDDAEALSFFDHLVHLRQLESLKCVIVNPNTRSQVVTPISILPPSLKKLSLSGFGYPWEYMKTIAKHHNLEVLKLRGYAFRGPTWEVNEWDFSGLKLLLIEGSDLEYLGDSFNCFPVLERLIIWHCYNLKKIPDAIGKVHTLKMIELVDCNPSVVAYAKEIQKVRESCGDKALQVSVRFSADDVKLKA
ncbi:hypothetical protein BUALT_Bualt02G0140500 [Buddleja alternifolia]|uniref:NB-ARC domain-containing protein n=1 Tax=Buddleja alternifolia TaxID=168488 RepID=A0AAV6Y822_9LAMI|nr:hypothetical protein BUALT_Bualt02G0140500 [Buddleja alternifolia]